MLRLKRALDVLSEGTGYHLELIMLTERDADQRTYLLVEFDATNNWEPIRTIAVRHLMKDMSEIIDSLVLSRMSELTEAASKGDPQ